MLYWPRGSNIMTLWGQIWPAACRLTLNCLSASEADYKTYPPCTLAPPGSPGCPSAAAAAWGCGRRHASSSCRRWAQQWWRWAARRRQRQCLWWRAAWAPSLSRCAASRGSTLAPPPGSGRQSHNQRLQKNNYILYVQMQNPIEKILTEINNCKSLNLNTSYLYFICTFFT